MQNELQFRIFGTMLDCSRNAVPNLNSLKRWIDLTAELGYNALLLYTEDTYAIDGEPFFGYMRGRFSQDELREIDRYAHARGMTLIPCIQALAHLWPIKRWPPYKEHFDTADILLVGDERMYTLIEHMFESIASCFTCKTIHIGMDEAHMLGRGRYYDLHGDCDRTKLMLRHLRRVCSIGEKFGFHFQIWSDMFFRIASGGEYYAENVRFGDEIRDMIPENVELVYWDYYSKEKKHYDCMIEAHHQLNDNLCFAGGLWSWTGFAPHNAYSIDATKAALMSCRDNGVQDVFLTLWGDDGAECSRFALLPSLFCAAELAHGNDDIACIAQRFTARFGISFNDFMLLDLPGTPNTDGGQHCNQEKYALYNDCFQGLLDKAVQPEAGQRYGSCVKKLEALETHPEWGYLFRTLAALCRVLETKATLGTRTRRAYHTGDHAALRLLIDEYLALEMQLEKFYDAFQYQWMLENKPYGFEIQDIRLGGLIRRVQHCRIRLERFCAGTLAQIEELEETQLDIFEGRDRPYPPSLNDWRLNVSANYVSE